MRDEMRAWVDHAIWWQVYPLGFTGAPIRDIPAGPREVAHRLPHLTDWIPYAVELGCSGLLLGPVFDSTSHGYDTVDHFRVDPRLGDDADMDAFLTATREAGLRVVFDGVFNHVGREHPAFQRVLEQGASAPEADWFRLTWPDGSHPGAVPQAHTFEGHDALISLDHSSPAVEQLVGDVMLHWLRRGISGWRLDAAYAVPPEFWARVLPRVWDEFPDAWFLGEVIHGDYGDIAERGTLDSITQYELWKATWSSLADRNFFELAWALKRHQEFAARMLPQTFVGNHDVTRIATKVGDEFAALAAVILFTVPGVPSVYYGDEWAYHGDKTEGWGGDDQVRPSFPASPAEFTMGGWMRELYGRLIGMRRRHAWLVDGITETGTVENERLTYTTRSAHGPESLTVELTLSPVSAVVRDSSGAEVFTYRP